MMKMQKIKPLLSILLILTFFLSTLPCVFAEEAIEENITISQGQEEETVIQDENLIQETDKTKLSLKEHTYRVEVNCETPQIDFSFNRTKNWDAEKSQWHEVFKNKKTAGSGKVIIDNYSTLPVCYEVTFNNTTNGKITNSFDKATKGIIPAATSEGPSKLVLTNTFQVCEQLTENEKGSLGTYTVKVTKDTSKNINIDAETGKISIAELPVKKEKTETVVAELFLDQEDGSELLISNPVNIKNDEEAKNINIMLNETLIKQLPSQGTFSGHIKLTYYDQKGKIIQKKTGEDFSQEEMVFVIQQKSSTDS